MIATGGNEEAICPWKIKSNVYNITEIKVFLKKKKTSEVRRKLEI